MEESSIEDFIHIIYSYAVNGRTELQYQSREDFENYIFDRTPREEIIAAQPFEKQSKSLLDELDAFTAGFPTP